jgi:thymidylate synthase (FAD)
MPHTVEINAYPLARTAIDPTSVQAWLERIGAGQYSLHEKCDTDSEKLIGLAGRRCYMSFEPGLNPNVTRIREDWDQYFSNILRSGHGSILEHATWTWAIEGVSRVFTGEMNRHRAGVAISEGSMRYIRYEDIPYWLPTSLRPNPTGSEWEIEHKKEDSRAVFQRAFQQMEENYAELCSIWKDELREESKFKAKKQITSMMRRIIGMGVATGGIWTLNMRALRHVITMRAHPAAEEEILLVASTIAKHMAEAEPRIFCDFEQEGPYWVPKNKKV